MTPEEKNLLERTAKMAEENNKILRGMKRSAVYGRILHLLYWLVIIGVSVAGYVAIQPYVEKATSLYVTAKSSLDEVQGAVDSIKR